jgi:hypothetical protein
MSGIGGMVSIPLIPLIPLSQAPGFFRYLPSQS